MSLTSDLVVFEVVVADEFADYVAFHDQICEAWDYIHMPVCEVTCHI